MVVTTSTSVTRPRPTVWRPPVKRSVLSRPAAPGASGVSAPRRSKLRYPALAPGLHRYRETSTEEFLSFHCCVVRPEYRKEWLSCVTPEGWSDFSRGFALCVVPIPSVTKVVLGLVLRSKATLEDMS